MCCNRRKMSQRQKTGGAHERPPRSTTASPDAVNWLNSGLMIATCGAAFLAPFHLFLFAYAILGPLHYSTQISWLHDRSYFAARPAPRRWWLALVGITMMVLIYGFVSNDILSRPVPPAFEIALVYLVLATALILLYVRRVVNAVVLVLAAVAAIAFLRDTRTFFLFAYFLVTIIHVLAFTAAFVLYGALKSRSRSGLISLAVFVVCIASFFVFMPAGAAPPDSLRRVYSFFEPLNLQLAVLFGLPRGSVYESSTGFAVMRLIAFAYTYHYLNWFSKTSIIRWHEVPRSRAVGIVALWALAVALYFIDYSLGLAVLYAASLLHVLLEFPLDIQTFAGIGRELRGLISKAA